MNDDCLLRKYAKGEDVEYKNVLKRLKSRTEQLNFGLTSHYIDFAAQDACKGVTSMSTIFTEGLPRLAEHYLEIDGQNLVTVKIEMMNEWQLLLADMSPTLLVSAFLWKEKQGKIKGKNVLIDCIDKNIKYTALPRAGKLDINGICKDGLYDVHIHINELLESDSAWMDCLCNPHKVIHELRTADIGNSNELYRYIRTAIKIYCKLGHYATNHGSATLDSLKSLALSKEFDFVDPMTYVNHWNPTNIQRQSFFFFKILNVLKNNETLVAQYFHYYLLLMGVIRRYLVMPLQNKGIYQFNRSLHSPFRGLTGKLDGDTLKQISGNDLNGITYIEGRFCYRNKNLWDEIGQSLKHLNDSQKHRKTQMAIVPYFVKGKSGSTEPYRYAGYFHNINYDVDWMSKYKKKIKGIDVAGNDFETSPDYFAPLFDRFREEFEIKHFTYHVGEDFMHIITGLRNIYEAVEFLKLGKGDRLSHVSAAGVDPNMWLYNAGETIYMPQGMWLDDLVFARFIIEKFGIGEGFDLRGLENEMHSLAKIVYGRSYNYKDLKEAWLQRYRSPEKIKDPNMTDISEVTKNILDEYHSSSNTRYSELIEVKCLEFFSVEELRQLQDKIMQFLCEKGIVVEILPTCNVYIGYHRSFRSYHILRWLKLGNKPKFVVGSDEPGVFSTNIYNEYANLYCMMRNAGYSKYKARNILATFAKDSKEAAF